MKPEFDAKPMLRSLLEHQVDFVVIGGLAGMARGSSYPSFDLDVAYAREEENFERLAEALKELGATLRDAPAGVALQLDARALKAGANFTFDTRHGSLDILGDATGAPPYAKLKEHAGAPQEIDGEPVLVASLDHLIAMKEAAGRTKDKLMATEYRKLSDLVRGADSGA
jgi:hypothetical protein